MSLDVTVYNALEATGIDPIFRGWLPEGQTLPCTVVRYVSDKPRNTLKGESAHKNQIIAIDCWGGTLEEAESRRDQILQELGGVNFPVIRQVIRPLHEPETKTFRFTIEYSVWSY